MNVVTVDWAPKSLGSVFIRPESVLLSSRKIEKVENFDSNKFENLVVRFPFFGLATVRHAEQECTSMRFLEI